VADTVAVVKVVKAVDSAVAVVVVLDDELDKLAVVERVLLVVVDKNVAVVVAAAGQSLPAHFAVFVPRRDFGISG